MKEGRNQKYLRLNNKKKILQLLSQREMSYSDLSRSLKLSNTAVGNIVSELIEDGIVLRDGDAPGRGGIRVRISDSLGYVVAVDFSKEFTELVAVTITGCELFKARVPFEYKIGEGTVRELFSIIDRVVAEQSAAGMRLCCIAVATPGRINKETGYFICAPRFQNYEKVNIEKLFRDRYGCTVIVKNDINLAMGGFRRVNGSDVENAVLIYNGVGLGCAMLLNGKVFEGSNGFAGEIGLCSMNLFAKESDNLVCFYDQDNYADTTLSILAIASAVKKGVHYGTPSVITSLCVDREMTIEDIAEAYRLGDALVTRVVEAQAAIMARLIRNVVNLLDVDLVIIDGEITKLGEGYYSCISKGLDGGVKIIMTDFCENLALIGAVEEGCKAALDEKIKKD